MLMVLVSVGVATILASTYLAVGNAPEALATFTTIERLDVLLADVILPGGVHGTELADAVRNVNPMAGVVFMTGYSDERLAIAGVLQTWVPVLRKPFQMHELAQAIEKALTHGSKG